MKRTRQQQQKDYQAKYQSDEGNQILMSIRQKARQAVKRGRILQQPCAICGNKKSEMHHEDYNKPYEIQWLCRKHHMAKHPRNYTKKGDNNANSNQDAMPEMRKSQYHNAARQHIILPDMRLEGLKRGRNETNERLKQLFNEVLDARDEDRAWIGRSLLS